jgi:hypothetical protein
LHGGSLGRRARALKASGEESDFRQAAAMTAGT